jgi:hypothetical protein
MDDTNCHDKFIHAWTCVSLQGHKIRRINTTPVRGIGQLQLSSIEIGINQPR